MKTDIIVHEQMNISIRVYLGRRIGNLTQWEKRIGYNRPNTLHHVCRTIQVKAEEVMSYDDELALQALHMLLHGSLISMYLHL